MMACCGSGDAALTFRQIRLMVCFMSASANAWMRRLLSAILDDRSALLILSCAGVCMADQEASCTIIVSHMHVLKFAWVSAGADRPCGSMEHSSSHNDVRWQCTGSL